MPRIPNVSASNRCDCILMRLRDRVVQWISVGIWVACWSRYAVAIAPMFTAAPELSVTSNKSTPVAARFFASFNIARNCGKVLARISTLTMRSRVSNTCWIGLSIGVLDVDVIFGRTKIRCSRFTGSRSAMACRILAVYTGVVPQQPPIMFAPSSTNFPT